MNSITAGIGLATVVAGPVLYRMVEAGELDGDTAMIRWALVAAGCALGTSMIMKLVDGYEAERKAAERRAALEEELARLEEAAAARAAREDEQGDPAP